MGERSGSQGSSASPGDRFEHPPGEGRCAFVGVDFSGARDAGDRTWVAEGRAEEDGLVVEEVVPARELEGGGRGREAAHPALRRFLRGRGGAAIGLDFPFGVPRAMVTRGSWEEFVRCFPEDFGDPEEFREFCLQVAGGKEWLRVTDREAGAPMSPYNRRTYRMTFYGVRDVLNPLISAGEAVAVPMQERESGVPWLMEACPACTLKERGLHRSYKGEGEERRAAREDILEGLRPGLALSGEAEARAVRDPGGDALDAAVAAYAAFRAVERFAGRLDEGDGEPGRGGAGRFLCLGDLIEGCIVH